MVFLLQNTQSRDTAAIQLKLDELIRANENARNTMLSLEDLTEGQLDRLKAAFERLAEIPVAVRDVDEDRTASDAPDHQRES
jgi:low affinity Fe/Cu permease